MNIIKVAKFIFELRGWAAGYKTYITAAAGICVTTAAFLNSQLLPWINGTVGTTDLLSGALPAYLETVAGFFAAGTLRHALDTRSVSDKANLLIVAFTASAVMWTLAPVMANADAFEDCAEHLAVVTPSKNGDALCRTGYFAMHNPDRKTPDWVAEHLTAEHIMSDRYPRTNTFITDPDLAPGRRATPADYTRSRYDRGHQAPSADFHWSKKAMVESFYMSNMAPQRPNLNRKLWAELEGTVRGWAASRSELYVITGPIYGHRPKHIGKSRVAVPFAFFKVIYAPGQNETLALVIPNRSRFKPLESYICTLAGIEHRTGLKFRPDIPEVDTHKLWS
ncbi:MAG: DNA/RNA non-specific endonuclease [Nitrospinae bacterium]|nr:DNA/RNA non-specific endonuclease [Nitrospinota bacterium]